MTFLRPVQQNIDMSNLTDNAELSSTSDKNQSRAALVGRAEEGMLTHQVFSWQLVLPQSLRCAKLR